jgi:hypothetical protein
VAGCNEGAPRRGSPPRSSSVGLAHGTPGHSVSVDARCVDGFRARLDAFRPTVMRF